MLMFIEILYMILRFFAAKDFSGMSLLTVVPVIPVIRLTFQEQLSAFVLTLPDASKAQLPLPLCGAAVRVEERPSHQQNSVRARLGGHLSLSVHMGV